MSISPDHNTIKTENDNLLSFMVDLYTDTENIGVNIRLLSECLLEWKNNDSIIQNENDQIPPRDVGPAPGVWTLPYPGAPY